MAAFEKADYETFIKRYCENRNDMKRKKLVMSLLEPTMKDEDRVLDLGCGSGAYSCVM